MEKKIYQKQRNPLNILFASAIASLLSTTITNPIQVMKLNQQYIPITCPQYPKKCDPSIFQCLCNPSFVRQNIFNGLSVVIPQVLFSNMVFMQLYQYQKKTFMNNSTMRNFSSLSTVISAVTSRTIVSFITFPIEAKRIRMTNHKDKGFKISQLNFQQNKSSIRATLTRDMTFSAIYWSLIQGLRNYLSGGGQYRNKNKSNFEIFVDNLLPGFISGCVASLLTNPIDIIKTRIQAQSSTYKSMRSQIIKLYKNQGIDGMLLGAKLRVLKSACHSMLYLMMFEMFLHNVHIN